MNLKAQVIAINKLLSDIYRRDMRLSYLLSELNFNLEDIKLIHQQLSPNVVAIFLNVLEAKVLSFSDGIRRFKIIEANYGLTDNRSETLRGLGAKLNISHERVRQIKEKTIKRLSNKNIRFAWESEFELEVTQLLDKYNDCAGLNIKSANSPPKHNFCVSLLSTGEKCLIISEESNKITVRQSDFQDFHDSFLEKIRLLKWNSNKIDEAKEEYPRAYEKWTAQEERWLKDYLEQGLEIKEIAALLERQPGAISSRIHKLGLPYI